MCLGAAILCCAAWVGWRTYEAYHHLQAASADVTRLQSELSDVTAVDFTAVNATVADLQGESAQARSAASDPIFRAAGVIPWIGPNLRAVRQVTLTVDTLSTEVVPSLVDVASTLRPADLAPKNGVINLAPIEKASPLLQAADAAVKSEQRELLSIDRSQLIEPVSNAVVELSAKLNSASVTTDTGSRIARLLPEMLGARGPRTYLVVFQNLAEVRATGGIFGSYAAVRVDHGRITIVDQGTGSRTLRIFDPPVASLDSTSTTLFSPLMGSYPQDVNFTPDFPTAAGLFAKMYTERKGTRIDGVIATDPVALSYALKGTGPIAVGDGLTLTSQTVVPILLSTAYQKFETEPDQSERDAFLAGATATAFARIVAGDGNASLIVDGLRKAVNERRLLVWSADSAEQADIATTGLVGTLSQTSDSSIGVFLNDGTGAKLDYYLTNSIAVVQGSCRSDGRRELDVTLTMDYSAPTRGLPGYVTGLLNKGKPYVLQTNLMFFAPVGGGVDSVVRDGQPIPTLIGAQRARQVAEVTVRLQPGSSTVLKLSVLEPAGESASDRATPDLVLTPGVHPWSTSVGSYQGCAGGQH